MADAGDPTISLEAKLAAFAATLTDDEQQVLHEVVHLAWTAGQDPEVAGFGMPTGLPNGLRCDPCGGGEVTFPNTFSMLGNLHTQWHQTRPPARPR